MKSDQFQLNKNLDTNQNLKQPYFNSDFYFSKEDIPENKMNGSINVASVKNQGFMNINNNKNSINDNNNLEENFIFEKKNSKLKQPRTEEKELSNIDYKLKGVYKKNIIKQKSHKSSSNSNSDNSNGDSNTKLKQIKVNTVGCYKKNINRNFFNKNSQQNSNKNNIINNQTNQMSQINNMNSQNIQNSNIQISNIKYNNNEILNLNSIPPNIIKSQNNNFTININQSDLNPNFALQNDLNQDSIDYLRGEQIPKNQIITEFSNISQNMISMDNIKNINREKINKHQDININNNIKKSYQKIQNNNQLNPNKKSEINKMKLKVNNYSFHRYKKPAMTGLKNLGNTSYLNSTLQLLCNIRNFASYFLNPKNGAFFLNNLEKYSLSFVFHRLCLHLYPYPEKLGREIYAPNALKIILGSSNCVYKDYTEKDPNMLICYILFKLIDEFNDDPKNENNYIDININVASNRNSTINIGLKNLVEKYNKSVLFNYFNWFEIKETKCMKCNNDLYSFQTFSTFDLNLYDAARYKKLTSVKIENCLEFYNIPKIKKSFCYFCKGYKEVTATTQIYSSPNIFLFLLNLEDKNEDDDEYKNINFILEKKINIGNYIENKYGPSIYELNGIVLFNKKRKKYVTLSISPVDYKWYLYNDDKVEQFDYDDFMEYIYKNNIEYQPRTLLYKNVRN